MIKRTFDILLSSLGLLVSSPLWVLLGLSILIEDGWPIFYLQERVGKRGKRFKALKFRSMVKDAEEETGPLQARENDPRIIKVGRILRATAMDELPQLLNILKGDMSFVGPRPMRPHEIEAENWKSEVENRKLENADQKKEIVNCEVDASPKKLYGNRNEVQSLKKVPGYHERQTVRPGLTGLAQIYLSTDTPCRRKFRYDLLYIKKQSFWLDLKLIFLSFWVTFRGKWESRKKKF